MSSDDSMSSSRLSQFGLYRTIDARTEEFLKLSRKRQIRQGCACAAVSTAVTVAVVVSMLFLYGYGIGSSASPDLRNPSWLDLMNDTSDTTFFDDKFKNSIKLDRASMNLLPVFFDKVFENHESSSQKYEAVTDDIDFQRNVFPGTRNWAKLPTSGLYSIQYKTYPVLYIQSPRNTDYFMKVRKTREYERIMSYIDKMINEKVGLGSIRSMTPQYPTTTEATTKTKILRPEPAKHETSQVLTKPKKYNKKNIAILKNIPKRVTPNIKFNNTKMSDHKIVNCKCQNQFGTLLSKLLDCFQEVVKDSSSHPPCNKGTEYKQMKMASEMKNQYTKRTTVTSTTAAMTTSTPNNIKPKKVTTPKSISLFYLLSYSTTPAPSAPLQEMTTTPKEVFNFEDSFSQNSISTNTKIKNNELINQMSPLYIISDNKNSQKNFFDSNNILPIKPKKNILSTVDQNYKELKKQKSLKNDSFSSSERKYDVQKGKLRIPTTTSPDKSEETIQNLLFLEGNEIGFKKQPQILEEKYSLNDLSTRNYKIAPEKQPLTTTTPQTDKHINNGKIKSIFYAPVKIPPIIKKRQFHGKYPEDYIMERFRHGNSKIKLSSDQENKRDKNSNGSMLAKIKDLLKAKLMRRKNPYNNPSSQLKNSKTESRLYENMQLNLPKQVKPNNKTRLTDNLPALQTAHTTSTTTTTVRSAIKIDTIPTQLVKYSQDPLIPDMTTLPTVAGQQNYDTSTKMDRKDLPYTNSENLWSDDDLYNTAIYDNAHVDFNVTTVTPKKYISAQNYFTGRFGYDVKSKAAASNEIQSKSARTNNNISAFNNVQNIWEEPPPEDNYTPYMIPIGRKSYLEISRGDWKQKEPRVDDTSDIYDALDIMEK